MTELLRRSLVFASASPGARWTTGCSECGQEVRTLSEGRCPACGGLAIGQLPCLVPETPPAPWVLARGVLAPLGALVVSSPLLLGAWTLQAGGVCALLLVVVGMAYRSVHPRRHRGSRVFASGVDLRQASWDLVELPGGRGLEVRLAIETRGLEGERLEILVRLRGPDGFYLKARHPAWEGSLGEVRARTQTAPLGEARGQLGSVRLYLPLAAIELPPGTRRADLEAEILVGIQGVVLLERDLPVVLTPRQEEVPLLPGEEGDPFAFQPPPVPVRPCGLCGGDRELDQVTSCPDCGLEHHARCWDFAGGCAGYGCGFRSPEEE